MTERKENPVLVELANVAGRLSAAIEIALISIEHNDTAHAKNVMREAVQKYDRVIDGVLK